MKTGTLTDASLIETDVKRPPQEDGEVAERDPDVLAIHSGTGGAGASMCRQQLSTKAVGKLWGNQWTVRGLS